MNASSLLVKPAIWLRILIIYWYQAINLYSEITKENHIKKCKLLITSIILQPWTTQPFVCDYRKITRKASEGKFICCGCWLCKLDVQECRGTISSHFLLLSDNYCKIKQRLYTMYKLSKPYFCRYCVKKFKSYQFKDQELTNSLPIVQNISKVEQETINPSL